MIIEMILGLSITFGAVVTWVEIDERRVERQRKHLERESKQLAQKQLEKLYNIIEGEEQ